MKIFKIMLPVIALLAVGTGCANKHYANAVEQYNNEGTGCANKHYADAVEQHNNEESLDDINRVLYEGCINQKICI